MSNVTGASIDLTKLDRDLLRLSLDLPEKSEEVLTKVAENHSKRLKENTPSSGLSNNSLKDAVLVEKTKFLDLTPNKKVGFNWNQGWYAHFADSGTIYQKGQDFVNKTNKETNEESQNIIKSELREWLNGRN